MLCSLSGNNHKIIRKTQTVGLTASNIDTFVGSAVTVCPIHLHYLLRGVVTAHTLAGVQHPRWTVVIYSNTDTSVFFMITYNATDIFHNNWRQAKAWLMLFVGAVEVNTLVQGMLRRVTHWSWMEHPTFQLRRTQYLWANRMQSRFDSVL